MHRPRARFGVATFISGSRAGRRLCLHDSNGSARRRCSAQWQTVASRPFKNMQRGVAITRR